MYKLLYLVFFVISEVLFSNSLKEMSLEEKVGQLFVVPCCPTREEAHFEDLKRLIESCHIGGVIVKQGDRVSQIALLNRLQKKSKYPLLTMADYEWGLAMMMKSEAPHPKNAILGEIGDLELISEVGEKIAQDALSVGVALNLAPVVDVNSNPNNPIIGVRSFGEDPEWVAECSLAFIEGAKKAGGLTCAKHFPGHGDTDLDSHKALPILNHSMERLKQVELLPFQKGIEGGIDFIMVGHLLVPVIDAVYPATLSEKCVQKLLKEEMGFSGLVITDALNMKALSEYSPEEAAFLARKAGCDLLLYGTHISEKVDSLLRDQIPRAYNAVLEAYKSGLLDVCRLDETVEKILEKKERVPLLL